MRKIIHKQKTVPKYIRLPIILILILLFVSLVVVKKYLITNLNKTNVWYVKSPTEEMVCWIKKDFKTCSWSWTREAPNDKSLVTASSVLTKPYPDKVTDKKFLFSTSSNSYSYSPVGNFKISSHYLFYTTLESDNQNQIYMLNKKNGKITKIDNSIYSFISTISPDEKYTLIGNLDLKTNKPVYYLYNIENGSRTSKFATDTFSWSSDLKSYTAGLINLCDPKIQKTYICPVTTDLYNCPQYPQVTTATLESYINPFELDGELVFDLPLSWKPVRSDQINITNSIYLTFQKGCQTKIKVKNNSEIQKQTVDTYPAVFFLPKKQQPTEYTFDNLVAQVEINKNSVIYTFSLFSIITLDDREKKPIISDLRNMLKTIKFNQTSSL